MSSRLTIEFLQLSMQIIKNTPDQEQNNEWMNELEHDDPRSPQLLMQIIENTPDQEQNNAWMNELEHGDRTPAASDADHREHTRAGTKQ
jgi:hypothetical protein